MAADQIAEFCAFTGAGPEEAPNFLEMAEFSVERAVQLFMELGAGGAGAAGGGAGGAGGDPFGLGATAFQEEDVRAPMQFQRGALHEDHGESQRMQRDQDSMLNRLQFARGDTTNNRKAERLNSLFRMPSYNFRGSFIEATEKAEQEKKLLIVNIQDSDSFPCHTLNRDIFNDEVVTSVIENAYVLFQRDDKSTEGAQYLRQMGCSPTSTEFPVIRIMDPHVMLYGDEMGGVDPVVKAIERKKWTASDDATNMLLELAEAREAADEPTHVPGPVAPAVSAARPTPPAVTAMGESEFESEFASTVPSVQASGQRSPRGQSVASSSGVPAAVPAMPGSVVAAGGLLMRVKLPDGKSERLRLAGEAPLSDLRQACAHLSGTGALGQIKLFTAMPRKNLFEDGCDLASTLTSLGVGGQALTIEIEED